MYYLSLFFSSNPIYLTSMERFLCTVVFFSHHTNVGNLGNSKRLSLALCFLLLLMLLLRHRAVRGRGWEELLFL